MAFFQLPQVISCTIQPKSGCAEIDPFINESLVDYLLHAKGGCAKEAYSKLSTVCDIPETKLFFKYVEVFHTFPFDATKPLNLFCFDSDPSTVARAFNMVRKNGTCNVSTLEDADVAVADIETSSDFSAVVRVLLASQKLGGHTVVHIPEIFSLSSVQLVYLMCCSYTSVYVYAPMLYSGQTKFVIGFNKKTNVDVPDCPPPFAFSVPQLFLVKLTEINTTIGQKRLEQVRFPMNCDYECVIWKSKYLGQAQTNSVCHRVNDNSNGRTNQVQQTAKTAHGEAVD